MARPGGWKLHRGQGCPEQRWHSRGRCSDMYGLQWKKSDDDFDIWKIHVKSYYMGIVQRCWSLSGDIWTTLRDLSSRHSPWILKCARLWPVRGRRCFSTWTKICRWVVGEPEANRLVESEAYYGPFHFVIAIAFQFWCKVRFLSLAEGPGSKDRGSWHAYLVRFIFNIYPCVSLFPNSLKHLISGWWFGTWILWLSIQVGGMIPTDYFSEG